MRLDVSLKQTQKLAMTTELRQSIEILQYNHFELIEFLMEESELNPTIEVDFSNIEMDFYSKAYSGPSERSDNEDENNFEKYIIKEENLYDYVYEQLILSNFNKTQRIIGELLLGLMDENGYIKANFYDFSNKYNFSFEEVMKVLKVMQEFSPTGICSTSLEECLLKQAKERNFSIITQEIIKNDLVDLAENRVSFLAEKYKVDPKEIQGSFDKIKSLDPKPGKFLSLSNNPTKFIIPDVILEIENEQLKVSLNEDAFIKVSENNFYKDLANENIDSQTKEYLKTKFKSTNWIINSINQRRETILKVSREICNFQRDYLLNKGYIKPMTMVEIADKIEVHESTISRTVNGKYIQTPSKVIELKDFFKGGLTKNDQEVSTDEIKIYIKTEIEGENKKKPISDQDITDKLNELGYEISRRTVAKYRDQMGILNSSKRKRF